jgi:hypothetical protein
VVCIQIHNDKGLGKSLFVKRFIPSSSPLIGNREADMGLIRLLKTPVLATYLNLVPISDHAFRGKGLQNEQ